VDQSYILEGGGLILQQPDGVPVMRADPSIIAQNNTNSITINFNLTHVIAIPGKDYTYGEGNCFIRTNYSNSKLYTGNIPPGGHIRIYTSYLNAWNESLHNILGIYAVNGYIHITMDPAQPSSYIELAPSLGPKGKSIYLQLTVINIYVQIGQGWIL
jgi:hypothetical protein